MRKITLSILVLLLTMVTQGARADFKPWSGSGTPGDPYLIQSETDWDALALTVSTQSDFHDKYYRLTNDITVTKMVGMVLVAPNQTPNPFRGTFDGDGHTLTVNITVESDNADTPAAPFAQLSGATIKNLNVAGSITTNGRRPASITSFVTGSSTITNCTSSVAVTSSKEYAVDAGGFVGQVNTGSTLTLSNCLFTGSIAYTNATAYGGGGLVGFLQTNATANLTNCVFAPTSVSFAHPYAYFNMFANGEKNGNLAPCYINITNCFYDVSDGDHWKITGQGTHIPATIENNTDWQNFGTVVTIGYDYSGKTVTLGNNVSVSKVVGTVDRPFAGTFDGQGNKLTVNINVSSDNEHTPAAPFAAISGATIKNLHVAGSISSNCYRPAGIASFVTDDSEITNCKSSVNITASRSADIDAGGFVGRVNENKTITMTGCTFTGSINFSHTYGYEGGGMVGWTQTGASANLTNCLFAPTSVSFANSKSMAENNFHMIVGGIGSSTLTRCYYNDVAANNTKITQEGKQAYTISRGNGVAALAISGVGTTYSVSGIVVFSGGIEFNEVFYAGGDEVVNLLLAPGADPELNYHFYRYKVESGGGSIVTNLRNSATLTMADNNQIISAEWKYGLAYFNVTFAEGNDNEGWTIDPTFAQTLTDVTVSYAGVHKVKSVTNNVLPKVIRVDATHYTFRMPDSDTEVSTQLWYKLDEAADNSALAGKTNVFLKRTLQPSGWNTFCAPFAIADPASVFGAGVKVKQLIGASVTGNTLTLTFGNAASIAAGTPYLIKLNGEDPVDLAADGKEFEGVTQNYTAHPTTFSGVVSFVPVINPTAMTADDKTVLFVTGGNKLTYPTADGNINGFRAYFQLDGSLSSARSFVLDFGDGETTGLNLTPTLSQGEGVWYTLDGRKLQSTPTAKGVYIVNGKKTIIK